MSTNNIQARMNRTRRTLKLKYDIDLPKEYNDPVPQQPKKDNDGKYEKLREYIKEVRQSRREDSASWWSGVMQNPDLQKKLRRYLDDIDWYYAQNREAVRRAFIKQRFRKGLPISEYCSELVDLDQYDYAFRLVVQFIRKHEQRSLLRRFRDNNEDGGPLPPLPLDILLQLEKGRFLVARYRLGESPPPAGDLGDLAEDERPTLDDMHEDWDLLFS